jgi:glycosyltransferase involved in cell wall biosynthesis
MNVLDKNGLLAWWLNKYYKIPYIIVEHWSGYLPANFSFRAGIHGKIMKAIARKASCILPVSQMLENAMKACGIENDHWQRINNVVDDFFYEPISEITISAKPKDKFRLLHVSCFDEQAKNIQGMLRAVREVAKNRNDFELVVVGTGVDYQTDVAYAESLNFPEGMLTFTGEQTPREVAQWMQQSDAFVMFSRYETFAIVLAEATTAGIPFISTPVGIAEQFPTSCGTIVTSEDEKALSHTITRFLDKTDQYSLDAIKSYAERFTSHYIGKELIAVYDRCMHNHI